MARSTTASFIPSRFVNRTKFQLKVSIPPLMPVAMQNVMLRCFEYDPDRRPTFHELHVQLSVFRPSSVVQQTFSDKIKGLFRFWTTRRMRTRTIYYGATVTVAIIYPAFLSINNSNSWNCFIYKSVNGSMAGIFETKKKHVEKFRRK